MFAKDEGQNVTPKVTWTEVPVLDVMSALMTVQAPRGISCTLTGPGKNVATYLRWARAAMDVADSVTDADTQRRHSVEALIHAKRALDSLFDQHLRREWLHLQLSDRPSFSDRLELLRKRWGNRFPWRLIPRVVAEPRNEAEHDYAMPSVHDAGAAVEAAEAIALALPIHEATFGRPALVGCHFAGWRGTPGEASHRFLGFGSYPNEGLALCWQGRDGIVRLGAGRVIDNESAELVWCPLKALTVSQHIEVLKWWEQREGGWAHELGMRPRLELAGLDAPP